LSGTINVTVWNENRHEQADPEIGKLYPHGIHGAIAEHLAKDGRYNVRTATLDQPEHGLTDDVLRSTDVLIWWGHWAHREVSDEVAAKVQEWVLNGMGFLPLHSAHESKPFIRLMGTSCQLHWREAGEKERLWVINPGHPIVANLGRYIELPEEEMYGEPFHVPEPDEVILISWFEGGEVFRSGCTYRRGKGRVFYFRPGHESYPIYYNQDVLKVITNAVAWLAPHETPGPAFFFPDQAPALELIKGSGR